MQRKATCSPFHIQSLLQGKLRHSPGSPEALVGRARGGPETRASSTTRRQANSPPCNQPGQRAAPYLTEGGRRRGARRWRRGRRDRHPGPVPSGSGCSVLGTSLVTHACRKGGSGQGLEGKAGELVTEKHGPRLACYCPVPGAPQVGQRLGLPSPRWLKRAAGFSQHPGGACPRSGSQHDPATPNHQGPHPSAESAAETQDVFHATALLSRENPAKLILRHQSSSFICSRRLLTWKCDRS